jgi:predicted DNA binding CopG/RHH family protein
VTKSDGNDALLNRDWSAEWERLPAVKLPGSRAAEAGQITIRLAASALGALKSLAKRKTLPYHALARSWIVGSLSRKTLPSVDLDLTDVGLAADAQLNIKVDYEVLLTLKRFAHGHHLPYHRLARLWIYEGLRSEQAWVGLPKPSQKINMADLKVRERSGPLTRVRSDGPTRRRKPPPKSRG